MLVCGAVDNRNLRRWRGAKHNLYAELFVLFMGHPMFSRIKFYMRLTLDARCEWGTPAVARGSPRHHFFADTICDAAPSSLRARGRSAPTMDHTCQRVAHERARQHD